jgi:hypothetical protein
MGRVSGLSFSNAEDCLSSEGGTKVSPAKGPSVESDGGAEPARPKASEVRGMNFSWTVPQRTTPSAASPAYTRVGPMAGPHN